MRAAGSRHQSHLDIGLGKARALRGVPDVAHERHVHARTSRHAVHRRDHRLVQVFQGERDALDALEQLALALLRGVVEPLAHLDDVAAAAEGAASAGDDHDFHRVVLAAAFQRRGPRVDHFEREGVHSPWTIEHDAGDAVGDGEFEVVCHDGLTLLNHGEHGGHGGKAGIVR